MTRSTYTLAYPGHRLSPEDLLNFIEMDGFLEDWRGLGLNDDDLGLFQIGIMGCSGFGHELPGTDGLREAQVKAEDWPDDRVVTIRFVYFGDLKIVLLVAAYIGHEPLTPEGTAEVKELIAREREAFSLRHRA